MYLNFAGFTLGATSTQNLQAVGGRMVARGYSQQARLPGPPICYRPGPSAVRIRDTTITRSGGAPGRPLGAGQIAYRLSVSGTPRLLDLGERPGGPRGRAHSISAVR